LLSLKKKTLVGVAALAIVLSGFSAPALADTGDSPEGIQQRLREIGNSYTVGQELNAEDAEFIRAHAIDTSEVSPRTVTSGTFRKSGSGAGATGNITGDWRLSIGPGLTNSYSFNLNSQGSSTVRSIRTCGEIRAYGLAGSGGVGLVFSDNPCQTVNGRNASMRASRNYSALASYATIWGGSTFTTPTGSFQVAG